MDHVIFDKLIESQSWHGANGSGKITLRHHALAHNPVPDMGADDVLQLRRRLHLSRALFARCLRTNVRTLENWEQGRARPNAQAILLMRMVEQYPDTISRLAKV